MKYLIIPLNTAYQAPLIDSIWNNIWPLVAAEGYYRFSYVILSRKGFTEIWNGMNMFFGKPYSSVSNHLVPS
jgi:hypothetical protein